MEGIFWGPSSETKCDKGLVLSEVNGSRALGLGLASPCCMIMLKVLGELVIMGLKMAFVWWWWWWCCCCWRWFSGLLQGGRLWVREHCGVKDCCGKPGLESFSGW